jgi:O-acetylhomoserine/O-acetylserine sulfhydrylase-like pyridoxal-dependent enzyme
MPKHTQCVHSGARKDKATRGLNTPIYPSSAYEYLDAAENTYPRYFNTPNERVVVEKLCALGRGAGRAVVQLGHGRHQHGAARLPGQR